MINILLLFLASGDSLARQRELWQDIKIGEGSLSFRPTALVNSNIKTTHRNVQHQHHRRWRLWLHQIKE